jgi:O-antigen ligase
MSRIFSDLRLSVVCLTAFSLGLPIAIVGLAKVLLVITALIVIASVWLRHGPSNPLLHNGTTAWILPALGVLALSSMWSTGSSEDILTALTKHGKLILIPVLLLLVRSRRDALTALAFFIAGQVFLLTSSWLMFAGVSIPWSTSKEAGVSYATFSSYLDQSIMTSVFAALCWHLRSYAPTKHSTALALSTAAAALTCVFFVFQGRTGHLVAIALVTLAVAWEIPARYRRVAMALPVLLLIVLSATSGRVLQGLLEIGHSVQSFTVAGAVSTSSGIRLSLWLHTLQSIAEHPWIGTGVGSWVTEFNRQAVLHDAAALPGVYSNPHQEYLLWGTQLGLAGVVLFGGVLTAIYRDSMKLARPARRAAQSVLAAIAVACLFNCALYDGMIGSFFCVVIALVLALNAPVNAPTANHLKPH